MAVLVVVMMVWYADGIGIGRVKECDVVAEDDDVVDNDDDDDNGRSGGECRTNPNR